MSKLPGAVRLRGVRHNNLKNFDLDLPLNQLIVVTGLSGSGKSSLAFDTLFAEGQRRYIETFSPYARQFLDRMDKPQVDSIEGIPPAIAIEQRNAVKTTRSTVGTMTEICDYVKMLWPHIAQLHCRQCSRPVRKDSPQQIWALVSKPRAEGAASPELLVTFELPLSEKLSLEESLALVSKQGYQRLLLDGRVARLDEVASLPARHSSRIGWLTVIQDRIRPTAANRARLVEACEQAYHFGKGKLNIYELASAEAAAGAKLPFSNRLHCAACDIEYREPSPALFSFNHPVGACPACRGFGRVIGIDYDLALPDRSKTLAEGVVKPWQTGTGLESQRDLLRMCRHFEIPTNVPFSKLSKKWQAFVIEGEPDYGTDEEHQWPQAWYGVKGYFRWLETRAYKMHVRVMLSRYRSYTTCPDCGGKRFQPDALLYRVPRENESLTLSDFYQLPIRDAFQFIKNLAAEHEWKPSDPVGTVLSEVRSRLAYLEEVGLGYLTLDRPTRSLSGGETERVNLTTCLGTRLVNTLFVLDEPSVGLHPRDTERLVRVVQDLRAAGNTVVVVEHEASVMRAADQIIDLGPGHGATGGHIVFQGSYRRLLKNRDSLTGQYLSGRKRIALPARRPVHLHSGEGEARFTWPNENNGGALELNEARFTAATVERSASLKISHANRHNLKDLSVEIPLRRFVCLTGVSGSGKTTLMREVLLPGLASQMDSGRGEIKASDRWGSDNKEREQDEASSVFGVVEGGENIEQVVLVDQSALGKTPRSNPAVYIGAFDEIRELYAQSEPARQRGLSASAFSFNSAQGQCERCRGAGFEKIEMQFLSDVFIRCPDCDGRRYRAHILEIKLQPGCRIGSSGSGAGGLLTKLGRKRAARVERSQGKSVADLLDSTIEEGIEFLGSFPDSRAARRALEKLKLLEEVGLGYLKLGQPINTLSGGESQRLKLVSHLAEANTSTVEASAPSTTINYRQAAGGPRSQVETGRKKTLFLFDEPTTGLHFDDVRVLLKVFQRLVDAGHSVLVIEHNVEVIKSADWVIDLGPEAGDRGGEIVAQGTPEQIAANRESYTGQALKEALGTARPNLSLSQF